MGGTSGTGARKVAGKSHRTASNSSTTQTIPNSSSLASDGTDAGWETWAETPRTPGQPELDGGSGTGSGNPRPPRATDAAFEALVKHYQTRIYNHIARMVQDPAEAEDLAQETFVRAYQALAHFRGEASFQTWLYRIASNLAIDASRRRKRREWQTLSLDDPIDDEESPLARDLADGGLRTPGEAMESTALRDQVWSAIAELSDKPAPRRGPLRPAGPEL